MFYKYYNIHTVKVCLFTKLSPCQFYTLQKTSKQHEPIQTQINETISEASVKHHQVRHSSQCLILKII